MEQETTVKKENGSIIEEMFNVGAHYGYSKSRRHPSAKKVIFGMKNNVEVIDLEKTNDALEDAKKAVKAIVESGKQILFVGGKFEAHDAIVAGAKAVGMPYASHRWVGGTITNFSEIKKRIALLADLSEKKEKGSFTMYNKKERLMIDREIEDLEKHFGGLLDMNTTPGAFFVIDSKKEHIAVAEARVAGIPIISVSSSDNDLNIIDFPIPANEASRSSIGFFVDQIVGAIKEGQKSKPAPKAPEATDKKEKTA